MLYDTQQNGIQHNDAQNNYTNQYRACPSGVSNWLKEKNIFFTDKHSSLFDWTVSDEDKKFYNTDPCITSANIF